MAGWSSNSKYAFLGSLRAAAQLISYEISMGLVIMPVLTLAGSTNLSAIILGQTNIFYIIPLFPSFILFLFQYWQKLIEFLLIYLKQNLN